MPVMRLPGYVIVAASLVLGAGCASAKQDPKDSPTPVKEIVSGGGRIRGGTIRMDVQLGRPFTQYPIRNAAVTAKPNAVVTP